MLLEEETGRVLLTDFGLAAIVETGEGGVPRITSAGQIVGEARFMSPEQVRGEKVTGQTDVYQIGVLAYHLLTGAGPFAKVPTARVLAAHLKEEPPDLARLRTTVDPDLVGRCLAKDASRRPTTTDLARRFREEPGEGGQTRRSRSGVSTCCAGASPSSWWRPLPRVGC